MKKRLLLLRLGSLISLGINAQNDAISFTSTLEDAHRKEAFLSRKILMYDIDIQFGGKPYFKGKVIQTSGGHKIKIEKVNGETILFDGKEVLASGIAAEKLGRARFDIFTWSYFLGLPYKLNDQGTRWSDFMKNIWGDRQLDTAKLTFEVGIGDTYDDWYVVYQNPTTKMLEGAAYIVSFGKGKEAAEKEPHAIKYNNFINVNGIPISTRWTFHMWSQEKGYGTQIGEVNLNNVLFVDKADFSMPKKVANVKLP